MTDSTTHFDHLNFSTESSLRQLNISEMNVTHASLKKPSMQAQGLFRHILHKTTALLRYHSNGQNHYRNSFSKYTGNDLISVAYGSII